MSIATFGVGTGALIAGLFGMNVRTPLPYIMVLFPYVSLLLNVPLCLFFTVNGSIPVIWIFNFVLGINYFSPFFPGGLLFLRHSMPRSPGRLYRRLSLLNLTGISRVISPEIALEQNEAIGRTWNVISRVLSRFLWVVIVDGCGSH